MELIPRPHERLSLKIVEMAAVYMELVMIKSYLELRSPATQYSSVCISVRRDTVLWKANTSSSPVKIAREPDASCCIKRENQITAARQGKEIINTSKLKTKRFLKLTSPQVIRDSDEFSIEKKQYYGLQTCILARGNGLK